VPEPERLYPSSVATLLLTSTAPFPFRFQQACAFRCPVHSHLRRAPEGPEQVPHVPYRVGHARVLLEYGVDMEVQDDMINKRTRDMCVEGTAQWPIFARTALYCSCSCPCSTHTVALSGASTAGSLCVVLLKNFGFPRGPRAHISCYLVRLCASCLSLPV
jgi:hypothetical protein